MKTKKIALNLGFLAAATVLAASCTPGGGGHQVSHQDIPDSTQTESTEIVKPSVELESGDANSPRAEGTFDYSQLSWKDKSKILAQLEKYSLENHTAGIPLYDDASFEQFSQRITLPSTKYLTNYGFGVGYGTIDSTKLMYNGAIDEANDAWKTYFHGYTNTDSGTFNAWNSTGSDVSDRASMITSSYFGVKAAKDNSSYSWVGSLSTKDAPVMLSDFDTFDSDGNLKKAATETTINSDNTVTRTNVDGSTVNIAYEEATSQYWRVYVHTGEGYTYHTAPTSKWKTKYDGRQVALDDYLTPFKALLLNNLARTAETISDTSGFQGAMSFFYNNNKASTAWTKSGVMIQTGHNTNGDYIDFGFIQPKSVSYARTALSSSLYSPLPSEFLTDVGGATNYGTIGKTSDNKYDDVFDNILFFGPYIPEYWQQKKQIAYQRNSDYYEASDYHFDGYTEVVFEGSTADTAAYTAFLNNQLDEVTIPVSQLKDHKNDPTVLRTEGSTIIKMNLNTTTAEEWEYYFGEDGVIHTHPSNKYWDSKPIMADDDFLTGLYFAINRKELADAAGRNPAMGYLSSAYMLDPAGVTSYRGSDYGKAVLYPYQYTANNEYGYSKAVAENYFKRAGDTMISNGYYHSGDKIEITGVYRYQSTIDNLGNYIKAYVEDAFNEANKSNGLTIQLKLITGGNNYTDTYTKMDNGEFDFAEGAISGNVLNPLEFMNTLSSTKALNQGFNLNWGHRTDSLSEGQKPAMYDGKAFSYDALWNASQGFTPVEEGLATPVGSNAKVTYVNKKIHFQANFPETATDEQGNSLFKFAIKDFAIIGAVQEGGFDAGYYADTPALKVSGNGYVYFDYDPASVQSRLNMMASQVASGSTIEYFRLYFTLVYSIALDSGTITKTVQMDVGGPVENFGLTPVDGTN